MVDTVRVGGLLIGALLLCGPLVARAQSFSVQPSTTPVPAPAADRDTGQPALSFGTGSRFLLGDSPLGAFMPPVAFDRLRNGGSANLGGPATTQPMFSLSGSAVGLSWNLGAAAVAVSPARPGDGGVDAATGRAALGQFTLGYNMGPVTVVGVGGVASDRGERIGTTSFVQGGAEVDAPLSFTLGARLGYQWSTGSAPAADVTGRRWSVGLSRNVAGFNMSVQYGESSEPRDVCDPATATSCVGQRVLFSIDRRF